MDLYILIRAENHAWELLIPNLGQQLFWRRREGGGLRGGDTTVNFYINLKKNTAQMTC